MAAIDQQALVTRLLEGDAGNAAQKGAALEAIVADTLCRFDGVGLIKRNVVDNAGSLEIDLLLYNQRHPTGLPFLPNHLIVECKNWADPVDCATLTVFTGKLH